MDREKTLFEKKIAPILNYVGAIGAGLMSIMYVVIVVILITGFKAQAIQSTITFALVNAVVGLIIMQFLKIQGISFAKSIPENKDILTRYYNSQTRDKKLQSINYYWTKSVITDILTKGLSIIISTTGLIYIVIQGSNDYTLLLLALVNLVMFICFGLLALNNAYEFFNTKHIPYILNQLEEKENNVDNRQQSIEESGRTSSEE